MRLIGSVSQEIDAQKLSNFLHQEGIANTYEKVLGKETYPIYEMWICNEEDMGIAYEHYQQYLAHPEDKKFTCLEKPKPFLHAARQGKKKHMRYISSVTVWIVLICSAFFIWNDRQLDLIEKSQGAVASEVLWTPLLETFLFDDPVSRVQLQEMIVTHHLSLDEGLQSKDPLIQKQMERVLAVPTWGGVLQLVFEKIHTGVIVFPVPLFEKISQGQVWRFFSPCLVHRDLWHLFFNMTWFWTLGMQIESRLKIPRMLLLIAVLGVVSNVSQYLVSGPYFLGFSGVIVGLAGFIWSRQRKAPWEGYPLQRAMSFFLFLSVIAMFLLGLASFIAQATSIANFSIHIANTAHLSGGLLGWVLGRSNFFAKRFT